MEARQVVGKGDMEDMSTPHWTNLVFFHHLFQRRCKNFIHKSSC